MAIVSAKNIGLLTWRTVVLVACFSLSACSFKTLLPQLDSDINDSSVGVVQGLPAGDGLFLPSASTKQLPMPPLEVTKEVKRELNEYLRGDGSFIRGCLVRRNENYLVMARIFDDEGVPRDMMNLAIIESGFRPEARSPSGAVGMWQFMSGTAKKYGLKVNKKDDQRKDMVLSTIAAARHLKDLFVQHKDWYLALAAYNAGSWAVGKAVSKTGSETFWDLLKSGKLANQTARFVPKFIAATILAKTFDRYGSENLEANMRLNIAASSTPGGNDVFALNSEGVNDKRVSNWTGNRRSSAG